MRALVFERSLPRFAAARVAGALRPGGGARVGPLSLDDLDEPALPGPGWQRVRPRLSGICGSDLATIDGKASRYFEPIVSFPFVPGHEVVGELDDGRRVVVIPVLACATRGIEPACDMCRARRFNLCERTAFGHLEPGLQSGYCEDTGGGWGTAMVAHETQLRPVPDGLSDEGAVMVEPAACAVHAARSVGTNLGVSAGDGDGDVAGDGLGDVAVVGGGTLGLLTIAAIRRLVAPRVLLAGVKHPHQQRLARQLGADIVVEPAALDRSVRSATNSLVAGDQLTGGIDSVVDCVGSDESIAQALRIVSPGGTVHLVGMPGRVTLELTGLWHREVAIRGCYAYEPADFDTAFELVADAGLERLVSAVYPLDRFREAIEHAADAGRRGAVKIAFDLREQKERQ